MLSPQPKRLNTCPTPERFKAQPAPPPQQDDLSEVQHEPGHALPSAAGAWSIRSLFWQPQPSNAQLAAQTPACLGSGGQELEEEMGPLTQMAAAGQESVSQAFCPHCGCYLTDVGGTAEEQRRHIDGCQSSGGGSSSSSGGEQDDGGGAMGLDEDAGSDGHSEEGEQAQQLEVDDFEEAEQGGEPGGSAAGVQGSSELEVVCIDEDEEDGSGSGSGAASAMQQWLEARGLAKYADLFARAGADLTLLPFLTDADLKEMGMAALGARKKVLLGAAELAGAGAELEGAASPEDDAGLQPGGSTAAAAAGAVGQHAGGSGSGVGDWRALSGAGGSTLFVGNIRRYFQPDESKPPPQQQQQAPAEGILQYFQPKPGRGISGGRGGGMKAAKPAAAPGAGPAGAFGGGPAAGGRGRGRGKQQQWAHKAATGDEPTAPRQRFGGGGRGSAAQPVPLKPWHLVPGTSFVVDRFNQLPPGLPNRHWFLTHFHADHYKGLSSRFDRGTVYCSPPTARLVAQQLRVVQARISPRPLNQPFQVDGVRVTFLEANHCPGAVMILFEPPGGQRAVLHTGDCRLVPAMQQEPALQAVRGRCDLILDTTYCSPEYAFPTQAEVLQFSIDAVKAEAFNPKTLFLFGSYTIGKERLFLEAARVLQRKVYVSATKRKVLDCLDLPPEYSSLLTTNDAETNLHAVPLWMVTQKHMAKILKYYRGRFTNVVGFQPTGWTHQRELNKTRARGRRQQKGTVITYQVPYSEHSSFTELREFVGWLNPVRIIPHVNTDNGGPKATRMVKLLRGQASS